MPDATVPMWRRMASAVGPVRRVRLSRSSSKLTTSALRSINVTCSSSSRPASSNRRVSDVRVIAPAQPGNDGVAVQRDAGQRLAHAVGQDAAHPDGEAFLQHHHALRVLQRLAQHGERERPERTDGDRADLHAALAHFVDHHLHRAVDRAERNDDRFRVFGAIGADEAAGVAAELFLELASQFRDEMQRAQLFVMLQVAHLGEGLRAHQGADADRVVRVEDLPRLVRGQIRVDLLLRGHVDAVVGMGQDEAVHAHHHRARQFLGKAKGLDMQVERLLVVLGEQLDPAGIAHRHAVRMVVPDVDGAADRAIADGHHDGQSEARRVVDRLGHEQQALAAGGGCRCARPLRMRRWPPTSRRTRIRH